MTYKPLPGICVFTTTTSFPPLRSSRHALRYVPQVPQVLQVSHHPPLLGVSSERYVPSPCMVAPVLIPSAAAALVRRVTCPDGNVVSNKKCCDLFPVLEDIQKNLFDNGECGEDAHSALRIAFHDAIGFSRKSKKVYVAFYVAFIPASPENDTPSNPAAEEPMVPFSLSPRRKQLFQPTQALTTSSRARSRSLKDTSSHRVTCEYNNRLREAKFSLRITVFSIQFASAVGVSNCPGAPRLEFLLGRPKATRPAQDLTVPEPFRKPF